MAVTIILFALLACLLPTTTATPVQPRASTPACPSSTLYSTNITYYQGGSPSAPCGNFAVSEGPLTEGECQAIQVYGVGVSQLSNTSCVYAVFHGTDSCDEAAATSVDLTYMPKGNGTTCVDVGVLDGGVMVGASGRWSCPAGVM